MNRFYSAIVAILLAAAVAAADAPVRAQAAEDNGIRKFGDWTMSCRPAAAGAPPFCVLREDIIWRQTGKRVVSIALRRPKSQQSYVMSVTAPLGILLPAGLTLIVGEEEVVRFPLRICNVNGCQGSFALSDKVRDRLAGATFGEVVFRQPNGRPLRVEFSLRGFKEAYAALTAQ